MLTRRRSYAFSFSIVLALLALSAWLFYSSDKASVLRTEVELQTPPQVIAAKETPKDRVAETTDNEPEAAFLSEGLIEQIGSFVDFYENQSRYPVYSIPITDPDSVEIPEPFEETEVDSPLLDDEGNELSLRMKAAVDKFEYVLGEPVNLRVTISGLTDNQTVRGVGSLKKIGANALSPTPVELTQSGSKAGELSAIFETSSLNAAIISGDLIASVSINIDGELFFTNVPLRINKSVSARLENLGVVNVEGAFLTIPLQFAVAQTGYFYVQAYLFEQATNRPLLSIQTEGEMQAGNSSLDLRAHFHALKDAGAQGPYSLKIHRAFRSAEPGRNEISDIPVAINSPSFYVPSFSFKDYTDEAYVDPETQRRIQALRELTSNTEPQ